MAEKYTGVEKYIFSDVYNFFLKYKDIPDDDYHWNCCINDAKLLEFKYSHYPFAVKLIADTLNQLQFRKNTEKIHGYTYNEWENRMGEYKKAPIFSPTALNCRL